MANEVNVLDKRLKARYQRRYYKWKASLADASAAARELGIKPLYPADVDHVSREFERIYKEIRLKVNQLRAGVTRPRGRPRKPVVDTTTQRCAKYGCPNPAAPEFIFCSRECAPCGHYGYSTRPRKA